MASLKQLVPATIDSCTRFCGDIDSQKKLFLRGNVKCRSVKAVSDRRINSAKCEHNSSKNVSLSSACLGKLDRRGLLSLLTAVFVSAVGEEASAREKRKPKDIPEEDYKTAEDGLKYYDFVDGKGEKAEKGSLVSVHFDCVYRSLTVVSSRESKLLGGNRVIAQPYDFIVGSKPGAERRRDAVDSANGLFSAQAAPKPPKALYVLTEGMHVGGKRTVVVTPEEGYGNKGFAEIPPGATFELNIELLEIKKE